MPAGAVCYTRHVSALSVLVPTLKDTYRFMYMYYTHSLEYTTANLAPVTVNFASSVVTRLSPGCDHLVTMWQQGGDN